MSSHRRSRGPVVFAGTLSLFAIALLSSSARADDPMTTLPPPAPPSAAETPTEATPVSHTIDRTWLYNDDARVPDPLVVIGTTQVGYTQSGAGTRAGSPFPYTYNAFGNNTAQPGAQLTVGGEIGLFPRVSLLALAQVQLGGDNQVGESEGASHAIGGIAALRVFVSPASWTGLRMVASVGYVREAWEGPVYDDDTSTWKPGNPNGANGAWGQLALGGDAGRFRWAASGHLEHVFSAGRDPLDLMMQIGASYAVAGPLRLGAEWVGQDLEETFSPGAEGGARHFIGPIASLQLLENRMAIVAGPAIGLSSTSPHLVARAGLSYGF